MCKWSNARSAGTGRGGKPWTRRGGKRTIPVFRSSVFQVSLFLCICNVLDKGGFAMMFCHQFLTSMLCGIIALILGCALGSACTLVVRAAFWKFKFGSLRSNRSFKMPIVCRSINRKQIELESLNQRPGLGANLVFGRLELAN